MADEDDVRRLALALPGTTEEPWYGTPGFKVAGKGFLRFRTEAEGALVVYVSDAAEKETLVVADPEVYFTTPHYAGYPVVLVRLAAVDVAELAELITGSWRAKAPARLRRELDAASGPDQ